MFFACRVGNHCSTFCPFVQWFHHIPPVGKIGWGLDECVEPSGSQWHIWPPQINLTSAHIWTWCNVWWCAPFNVNSESWKTPTSPLECVGDRSQELSEWLGSELPHYMVPAVQQPSGDHHHLRSPSDRFISLKPWGLPPFAGAAPERQRQGGPAKPSRAFDASGCIRGGSKDESTMFPSKNVSWRDKEKTWKKWMFFSAIVGKKGCYSRWCSSLNHSELKIQGKSRARILSGPFGGDEPMSFPNGHWSWCFLCFWTMWWLHGVNRWISPERTGCQGDLRALFADVLRRAPEEADGDMWSNLIETDQAAKGSDKGIIKRHYKKLPKSREKWLKKMKGPPAGSHGCVFLRPGWSFPVCRAVGESNSPRNEDPPSLHHWCLCCSKCAAASSQTGRLWKREGRRGQLQWKLRRRTCCLRRKLSTTLTGKDGFIECQSIFSIEFDILLSCPWPFRCRLLTTSFHCGPVETRCLTHDLEGRSLPCSWQWPLLGLQHIGCHRGPKNPRVGGVAVEPTVWNLWPQQWTLVSCTAHWRIHLSVLVWTKVPQVLQKWDCWGLVTELHHENDWKMVQDSSSAMRLSPLRHGFSTGLCTTSLQIFGVCASIDRHSSWRNRWNLWKARTS